MLPILSAATPLSTRFDREGKVRFLSTLLSASAQSVADLDQQMIDAAIERTVDGTDRRLRAVGSYRKCLRPAVEQAVRHVISLVDDFPAASELSRDAFGGDPRVRALFSSAEQLQDVLGGGTLFA